jgi:hypothetical protein
MTVPPAQEHRPPASGLRALVQPKAGAAISPVPAGRFLAGGAQGRALAPVFVAFANVPGVQFDDQREGLQRQLELQVAVLLVATRRCAHLPVQALAFFLRALALHPGGPGQGAGGDGDAGQPLDDLFSFGRRHFADGQHGDFLHAGRLGALLRQTQQGVSGKTPLLAAPTVTAGPLDADVAPAGLNGGAVAVGQAAKFVLTVRTQGRSGRGFLLGGLFEHLAEQFVASAQEFFFQMAEVLIGGAGRGLELSG